ncbi:MAG: drug/metabolite transporter (DMT)-like permease [Rhodothermales bacterium]
MPLASSPTGHTFGVMDGRKRNLIQVNLAVLMWGGTAMFAKGIALPIRHVICLRSFIAALALIAIMRIMKIPLRVERKDYRGILGLGLLMCLHWLTYFEALRISTAVVAVLALHIYPVLTALVEPLVFKEKLKGKDVWLAFLVFLGLFIMTPELTLDNSITRGILLGVVSGCFFTGRNLLMRKYARSYSSYTLMSWQAIIIGVVLTPVLILSAPQSYSSQTVGLLLMLGLVFTAVPHTLYCASFRNLSAKTVGVFGMLLPLYAAVLGYFIHNEGIPSGRTLVGGTIILGCVIFETVQSVKDKA